MIRIGDDSGSDYHKGDEAESENCGLNGSDRNNIQVIYRMSPSRRTGMILGVSNKGVMIEAVSWSLRNAGEGLPFCFSS